MNYLIKIDQKIINISQNINKNFDMQNSLMDNFHSFYILANQNFLWEIQYKIFIYSIEKSKFRINLTYLLEAQFKFEETIWDTIRKESNSIYINKCIQTL